jgi:hypothetical protein
MIKRLHFTPRHSHLLTYYASATSELNFVSHACGIPKLRLHELIHLCVSCLSKRLRRFSSSFLSSGWEVWCSLETSQENLSRLEKQFLI